jgi:DNA-binding response OmpR family regulator
MSYLLIVDDDEDFASAVAALLRGEGHEVRIELDLSAAMRSMTERRPDLVLLDVMFPEDSTGGFELARTMRLGHDALKDVPILMLTAVNTRFPSGSARRTSTTPGCRSPTSSKSRWTWTSWPNA